MNKLVIIVLLIIAVAMGGFAFIQSKQATSLKARLDAARAETVNAVAVAEEKDLEMGQLTQQMERLKADLEELPGLRGEVTQLRQTTEALQKQLAVATQNAETARSRLQATQSASAPQTTASGRSMLSLALAPAHIRNKIALQYPGAKIGELVQVTEDEGTFYSLEGVTANDREMRAVLDANGEILEQALKMSFSEVPNAVKGAVGRQLNRDGGIDMTQIWEDGQTTYRGNAEQNGQEMQFVFSETGELIRYETWVEQPEVDAQP